MRKRFARVDADSRRTSLIEATARVLAERGTAGASVRAIAAEAGVSPGLVTHHFASVDTLIAQTYAHVAARVDRALADAVARAGEDPRARLDAYVRASFAPPIADPALLATWTAFWGLVRSNPGVAAEHDRSYATYREDLERLLAACGLPQPDCRIAAISITALVDGLWLELCLTPGGFTAAEAITIADLHVTALLPG
ncbi:TetR family transcriptional regulator C-terminal domain-containing protein [uncultured Sphingomonas sp.]|uniref:TetR family transcriptional regulator C-terminal domain-containing protein n=1 Tax=unclassified Sphingomonas TaxID=196159 RepID=UPI0025DE49A1|nr:TetR family transcriptional regulator C-terminal domain-containing protein [uncultured Sphingomonas sp.]